MKNHLLIITVLTIIGNNLVAQTILGVDVSHYQGTITWSQALAAGKKFAFVKATGGTGFTDPNFVTNETSGASAGVKMGAYHFAYPEDNSATDEANYFLSVAGSYIGTGYLPPVLDLEDPGGTDPPLSTDFTSSQLTAWVQTWVSTVQAAHPGVTPIIYVDGTYASYLQSSINIYGLWIADWDNSATAQPSNIGVWNTWLFKQYWDQGSVSGISGTVDLDVFNGTTTAFNNLIGTTVTCAPWTVTPSTQTASSGGGNYSATVGSNGGCSYDLTFNESWLTFSSYGTGGLFNYTVAANTTCSPRTGTISINDYTDNISDVTTLTITQPGLTAPSAPTITSSNGTTLCSPSSTTLSVTNGCSCTYNWSTGATTNYITVSSSGTYYVYASNTCGQSPQSNSISVTVNTTPATPSPTVTPNPVCLNGIVTLNANTSSSLYTWSNSSNGYNSTSQNPTFTATSNSGGQYCLIVTQNGCSSPQGCTSSLSVTQVSASPLTASPNPVCVNGTVNLSAASGATMYQWSGSGVVGNNSNNTTAGPTIPGNVTYTVTATLNSCTASASTSVTVNPTVTPTVSLSQSPTGTICGDGTHSVTITANTTNGGGNPQYSWNGCNGSANGNQYTISNITSSCTVSCMLTSNAACASSTTATATPLNITVIQPPSTPVPTLSPNPVCTGQTVALNANTSSSTYSWTGPNGYVSASQNPTLIASSNSSGQYCLVVSQNGCASPSGCTPSLTVNSLPVVTAYTTTTPICQGSSTSFSASGATSYSWNGTGVNGQTNNNITSSVYNNSGTYTLTVTGTSNGCSASATTSVTVNSTVIPSVLLAQSPAGSICGDGTHSVTITANPTNGGSSPQYNWSGCNGSANGNQYTVSNITSGCTVSCTLISDAACASTTNVNANPLAITVNAPQPTSVTISTPATTDCINSNVTFTATPMNGGNNPTYQWFVNTQLQPGTGPYFTITNAQTSSTVYCIMTSSQSCISNSTATSNSINDTIVTQATAMVNISASPSTTVCAGSPVTITASPGNGGNAPLYQWQVNGTNSGNNSSTPTFITSTLSNGAIISCVMTSNSTCVTNHTANSNQLTISVTPTVTPTINIVANPSGAICEGTPVTFTATSTNGGGTPAYQWKVNGSDAGTNSTIYSNSSLTTGEIVTCLLTSNASCPNPVSVTSNSLSMTVNSIVIPSVSITTTPLGAICQGTNMTFSAVPLHGGSLPMYEWLVNGNSVTDTSNSYSSSSLTTGDIITCQLLSNASCASPDTASSNTTVTIYSSIVPTVSITDNPSVAECAGTTIIFSVTSTGGGSPTYQWKVNGSDAGTNSTTFESAGLANGVLVTCVVTSSLSCANPTVVISSPITLSVKPSPSATITPNGSTTICQGDSVELSASAGNPLYQWSTGESTENIFAKFGGNYWVTVTNVNNCSASSTPTIITVNPLPPTPSITPDGDTLVSSQAITYQWYLNNTLITGATNQDLRVSQNGQYQVEITDSNGCKSMSHVFNYTGTLINNVAAVFNFTVMPNPADGYIYAAMGIQGDYEFELLNEIGQVIATKQTRQTDIFDTETLAAGIYFLRAIDKNTANKTPAYKVVIQH
jgi:GH25 family lysozyme M1 (1,4-beta-N-acetylmuramidase)